MDAISIDPIDNGRFDVNQALNTEIQVQIQQKAFQKQFHKQLLQQKKLNSELYEKLSDLMQKKSTVSDVEKVNVSPANSILPFNQDIGNLMNVFTKFFDSKFVVALWIFLVLVLLLFLHCVYCCCLKNYIRNFCDCFKKKEKLRKKFFQ
jgi:hypothetical protein